MVENTGNDGVDHILDGLRPVIKVRIRRDQGGACEQEQLEVLYMDQAERGFTRHQDQPLFLLQHHIGRAQEQIGSMAMSDAAKRTHGAWDDDHRIADARAAGERSVHALEAVGDDAFPQFQAVGQLLLQYLMGVGAQDQIDLMLFWVEVIQKPLGIESPTRSGNGDDDFHT